VFHGATYPAGSHVDSDVDLSFYKLGYSYRVLGTSAWSLRPGLSGYVWTFDGHLTGEGAGLNQRRSFTHVLPIFTLAADAQAGLWRAGVEVDAGGTASDEYDVDVEGRVGVRLWGRASVDLGYRHVNFRFHETTNEASLAIDGPFVGLSLNF
jgi:hypothetical protein